MQQNTIAERVRGSISLFLVLILMPLFSGTYLAIDLGRTSAAKSRLESALDLAGNAALNDYDQALKDWYGIFAMAKSRSNMETGLAAVFSETVDAGETVGENYINTATKSFQVAYPAEASLARPDVMERTVTDYMKYRAPYGFARGVSQRLGAFQNIKEASETLSKSQDYYESLSGVSKQLAKLADALPADSSEGFDADREEKAIQSMLGGLDKLASKVRKTDASAKGWKEALDRMPEGEAKALLAGDYKGTAEVLSSTGVEALRGKLEQDLNALQQYRTANGEAEAPELSYYSDSLYGYIAGSRATGSEGSYSLPELDRSTLVTGVPEQYVSRALGAAGEAIDALGSNTALSVSGSGSMTVKAQMTGLSGFFSKLTGSTDSLLADSFLEEFFTENFSCYTTGEKDKTQAGMAFSKGPFCRGEAEYLLFGKDYLPTNVHLTADLIFMVRVLFNGIYAFSNAKMRAEALSAASAVAAWTGAGVTVAQNLILGAWAMAESVSDLSTLLKGGSVPLYKNAATWTMSLGGVTNQLRNGAVSLASHTIDDVYSRIEKAADDKVEEVRDAALSYFRETTEGAVESLTNMVLSPVETRLTTLIGDGTKKELSESSIRELLSSAAAEADNGSPGFAVAKAAFERSALGPLAGVLSANLSNVTNPDASVAETASNAIRHGVEDAYATLFSEVEKSVNKKVSAAENTLHQALQEGGSELKADVTEALDDYAESLSGYLGSGSGTPAGNTSLSSYSGTAMSYKDYLKVFFFAGLLNNSVKAGILTRGAKVMQVNCHSSEKAFSMAKAYREVTLSGTANIVTHTVKGRETYGY